MSKHLTVVLDGEKEEGWSGIYRKARIPYLLEMDGFTPFQSSALPSGLHRPVFPRAWPFSPLRMPAASIGQGIQIYNDLWSLLGYCNVDCSVVSVLCNGKRT
jgi:hypothetical protein